MDALLARLWKSLNGGLQWRLLWLRQATFMIGVTGVVRDGDGRVLLLRHRLWPDGRDWGLPTGYAERGETFEDTVVREVREETALEVRVGRPVRVTSGYRLRAEIAYEAELVGGELRIDPREILEAHWFSPGDLPAGLMASHRALIAGPR
ncbi:MULTISPECIES: NUDIX domain-containing protein [Thermomonosporaceae]|uniref:NUDIX domain-containing protein n=1 Tax=Thermomonosporaceae TaxID=2012 RepID=UPI00255AA26D|nr:MULTISPECIES: NUDIX domain-containing protein [Thermomonosporaceae]MDL4774329.1 NUDIX domain-containing protein [Actinomadura xylanilytica]